MLPRRTARVHAYGVVVSDWSQRVIDALPLPLTVNKPEGVRSSWSQPSAATEAAPARDHRP